jgi:CDP-paratose 2-epimerase
MKVLITGACGFVGCAIARWLASNAQGFVVCGIDNFMRPGSESNRQELRRLGVKFSHGDIRMASDFEALPDVDFVIDAAANPSVLAGVGNGGSRQLMEHNLTSVVNVLEYCRRCRAGFILISTSRVYSISDLASLPLTDYGTAFGLDTSAILPEGVTACGVGPRFSTAPPVSLYGSTKLACEVIAQEYGDAFDLPVWINRCGVMAGAGQFGTPDQGIFSFWLNGHLRRAPLRYIGFDGMGKQVRDALHPNDLAALLLRQMRDSRKGGRRIYTAGGGPHNSMSLRELNEWCDDRFGKHTPSSDLTPRKYDIPWLVMDSADANREFRWRPEIGIEHILTEIAGHAQHHPDWLERSGL